MTIAANLSRELRLPVIAAPLFIISNPDLVIAQCKAGIVGSFARPEVQRGDLLCPRKQTSSDQAGAARANTPLL